MNILGINNSEINKNENLAPPIKSLNNNISTNIEKKNIIDCNRNSQIPNTLNAFFLANKIYKIIIESIKSVIPIFGTIRELKKGNILWGIFGFIADSITLILVIGLSDKLEGLLIQICKAIVRIGAIVAGTIQVNKYIITEDESTSKIQKSSKNKQDKIESTASINIPYAPTWHKLALVDNFHLYKLGRSFFYDFRMLEGNKVYKQLADASKASEFIVNGQNIVSSNPNNIIKSLQKIFPNDFQQIQLISSFAHEGIFNKPFTHNIPPIHPNNKLRYIATNGTTSYKINSLENGKLIFVAKYESRFVRANGFPNTHYNNFGVKVSTVISKDAIPEFNYSYYCI